MMLPSWLYRLIHPKRIKLQKILKGIPPKEYYSGTVKIGKYVAIFSKEAPQKTGKTALQTHAELEGLLNDDN